MIDIEKAKEIVLKDDATPTGGIAFQGETLYDFIIEQPEEQQKILIDASFDEINSYLRGCGIMPLEFHEFHKVYKIPDEIRQRELAMYEALKGKLVPFDN